MSAVKNSQFQLVEESGWKNGLGNLMQGEWSAWFKSSKWLKHSLIWFLIVNVMMLVMVLVAAAEGEDGPPVLEMYGVFGGLFVAFGVMTIMQRVLIGEKKSGTAAWVLSKPVTRTSFVVSRLVGNIVPILVTAVAIPGIIVYLTIGLLSDIGWIAPLGFAGAVLMIAIHSFFWAAMVLMIGTLTNSSSKAIGIPIALLFFLWMGSSIVPGLIDVSPVRLAFSPSSDQAPALSYALLSGEAVFSWLPLIVAVLASIVFVSVAIRRFNRQEF